MEEFAVREPTGTCSSRSRSGAECCLARLVDITTLAVDAMSTRLTSTRAGGGLRRDHPGAGPDCARVRVGRPLSARRGGADAGFRLRARFAFTPRPRGHGGHAGEPALLAAAYAPRSRSRARRVALDRFPALTPGSTVPARLRPRSRSRPLGNRRARARRDIRCFGATPSAYRNAGSHDPATSSGRRRRSQVPRRPGAPHGPYAPDLRACGYSAWPSRLDGGSASATSRFCRRRSRPEAGLVYERVSEGVRGGAKRAGARSSERLLRDATRRNTRRGAVARSRRYVSCPSDPAACSTGSRGTSVPARGRFPQPPGRRSLLPASPVARVPWIAEVVERSGAYRDGVPPRYVSHAGLPHRDAPRGRSRGPSRDSRCPSDVDLVIYAPPEIDARRHAEAEVDPSARGAHDPEIVRVVGCHRPL